MVFSYNNGNGFYSECVAFADALESLPDFKDLDYTVMKLNASNKNLAVYTKSGSYMDCSGSKTINKFDVTLDQLADLAASLGPGESAYTGTLTLLYGEILDVNVNDGITVIKAKISPSATNQMTIDQNYYNVCDLIRNQGVNPDELQYWAVADMTDGSEGKVISFTLDSSTIAAIKSGTIPENQLGKYTSDLWILPSLQ